MNLDLQKVLPAEAFETEQNEGDYIGKDGLLYCGVCRTKKQTRLPASDFTGGREMIVPCICKCKVEENKRKEEEEKKRQEMQRLERLKASSLMDAKLKAARLDGYQVDGDNQKIYNLAGNYVKRFDEMDEKRQGLLFWGTVGTGKSYTAACIANELLNQMIPVVMTSFVKILQNIQGNPDEEERIMAGLNTTKLLIIDEFPYACKVNESIPSILQVLWDEKLRHENVMIILCGSAMSFIEKELLAEKNPLYGRTTGIYKMKPLPYTDAIRFFPNYSDEDKLLAYAILGGIPHYLSQFDRNLSLEQNVKRNILRKGCALYNEVEFLLKQELRETAVYNTIVEAIALGCNSFSEILGKTQLEKSKLSVYLKNLIEISIVEKEVLPQKVWVDCVNCPKFPDCDETAVLLEI